MNIIKYNADLQKVLSVYSDKLPIKICMNGKVLALNNDTQIYRVHDPDMPQNSFLVIDVVDPGKSKALPD